MPGFDSNVSVQISIGGPSVSSTGFGVPLLATADLGGGFTERIRFYTTAAAIDADGDVNSGAADKAKLAFAQTPHVARVAIGRVALVSLDADLTAINDESNDWYGLALDDVTDPFITVASNWVLTEGKLFIGVSNDADIIAAATGLAADLKALGHDRTAILYRDSGALVPGAGAAMAWMGKTLATDPDVDSTIWAYKTLTGLDIDEFTDSEVVFALAEPANLYTTFKGVGSTGMGRLVDDNPIDVLIAKDWATARIEERASNLLLSSSNNGGKIPLTDAGIALVASIPRNVVTQGVLARHFVENTFVLSAPSRSQMPVEDVTARLVRVTWSVQLAGAIELLNYTGTLFVAV